MKEKVSGELTGRIGVSGIPRGLGNCVAGAGPVLFCRLKSPFVISKLMLPVAQTEVGNDAFLGFAHAPLHMGARGNLGVLVKWSSFHERAPHGIEGRLAGLVADGMQEVDHGAVELASDKIFVPTESLLVAGRGFAGGGGQFEKFSSGRSQDIEASGFGKVEAVAGVDDGADDERVFDLVAGKRSAFEESGPAQGSVVRILPKICPLPELVVIVGADQNFVPAGQDFLANKSIAAVVGQDPTRMLHGSAVGFGQGLAGFLEDAGLDQKCPGFGGGRRGLADKAPHLHDILLSLRPADRGKAGGHDINLAKAALQSKGKTSGHAVNLAQTVVAGLVKKQDLHNAEVNNRLRD